MLGYKSRAFFLTMKAVYVDWHLPRKMKGIEIPVKKHWEVVMIIRTTYFSREINGFSPVLYCDQSTYDYYESLDLIKHFDEVFPVLPNDPSEIDFDPTVFWAAAKFLAIEKCNSPFIMIDLDAEIRFKIDLENHETFFAHYEMVREDDVNFYPPPEFLDKSGFLESKYGIEWSDVAINTSIIYFRDFSLAKEFASSALDFMRNMDEIDLSFDSVSYILLVEQRLAYELCKIRGVNIGTLISGIYIPREARDGKEPEFINSDVNEISEKGFLHIWGYKKALNADPRLEEKLLGDLISSRLNLKEDIIGSISKNFEIYMNK